MLQRITIPIYQVEEAYFEAELRENRYKKSQTIFQLMKSGIKHWENDRKTSFTESICIPEYPPAERLYYVILYLPIDTPEWELLHKMSEEKRLSYRKLIRFFTFYDLYIGRKEE